MEKDRSKKSEQFFVYSKERQSRLQSDGFAYERVMSA